MYYIVFSLRFDPCRRDILSCRINLNLVVFPCRCTLNLIMMHIDYFHFFYVKYLLYKFRYMLLLKKQNKTKTNDNYDEEQVDIKQE